MPIKDFSVCHFRRFWTGGRDRDGHCDDSDLTDRHLIDSLHELTSVAQC